MRLMEAIEHGWQYARQHSLANLNGLGANTKVCINRAAAGRQASRYFWLGNWVHWPGLNLKIFQSSDLWRRIGFR